jgi:hypothetical protein
MQVWGWQILVGNRVVRESEKDFVTREDALKAGTNYFRDNEATIKAEYGAEDLRVKPIPRLVGGSLT